MIILRALSLGARSKERDVCMHALQLLSKVREAAFRRGWGVPSLFYPWEGAERAAFAISDIDSS